MRGSPAESENDNPTIGLLVCGTKTTSSLNTPWTHTKVPLGISEFNGIKFLPEAFKSSLPSIEGSGK